MLLLKVSASALGPLLFSSVHTSWVTSFIPLTLNTTYIMMTPMGVFLACISSLNSTWISIVHLKLNMCKTFLVTFHFIFPTILLFIAPFSPDHPTTSSTEVDSRNIVGLFLISHHCYYMCIVSHLYITYFPNWDPSPIFFSSVVVFFVAFL